MWRSLTGGSKKNLAAPSEGGEGIPLHDAIRKKDLKEVKKILDRAGESAVLRTDSVSRTALHVAAETGDIDIVKTVLKSVRDRQLINQTDRAGISALFIACQTGVAKACRELIKAGADANAKSANDETMLHAPFLAPFLTKGHTTVIKELCSIGTVDVAAVDKQGLCALQLACRKNAYDSVVVMLKYKADTTLVKGGEPPLFYATMAENPQLVRVLLEAGADIAQPSSSGQSLMEVVNPKCEIYRIIKKHVITRPGGARKLNLMSEESIVATSLSDLPLEVLQLVTKAGLKEADIAANWPVFCSIVHMICNRRIFATPEEAVAAREVTKQSVDHSEEEKSLKVQLLTAGDPQKIFKKMRVAGAGGFGMVFQGTGPDKKQWAIKRMGHSSNKERIQNLRECNFLRMMQHPNICAYKATYECTQQHELWLIMELMQGGTLDESVGNQSEEAQHFFEEKHLAYTTGEILKALEYMHGKQVIHRDLKSQNVMFTLAGEVKIIDFGTAVSTADPSVQLRDTVGSMYWMPPEMILRNPHGPPADVWSMAVCLLELANHHPPDNTSVLRHMFRVATAAPPFLDHPEKWSDLMRDFLSQCMQFDPSRRATAAVLRRHKWITSRACSQAEMSKMLNTIFASRYFNDV